MDKPLYVLHGTIRTPPMSSRARTLCGYCLRQVQQGVSLSMPLSRPMSEVSPGCHELRIADRETNCDWRIMYYIDSTAIVVLGLWKKETRRTPGPVLDACRSRLQRYLRAKEGDTHGPANEGAA